MNSGGLWKVNDNVEQILTQAELKFLEHTQTKNLRQIDVTEIVHILLCNDDVKANNHLWVSSADLVLDRKGSHEMLEKVLNLYLRVHPFSYAKDVVKICRRKQVKAKPKH